MQFTSEPNMIKIFYVEDINVMKYDHNILEFNAL